MANSLPVLAHLKACAEAAKKFTNGLVSKALDSVAEAMDEMDVVKADKISAVSISISTSGWKTDSSISDYPYYYEITANGITANDRANITISPKSQAAAIACRLCPTSETFDGKIRIRSNTIPTSAIAAEYVIEKGKGNR